MIHFSEPCTEVVAALFVCDENLGELKKNATNPAFRSKYADLGATCDAIQPGLDAGKLVVIQAPLTAPDGAVGVETMILHKSGQWVRPDPLFLPLAKADPQGAGSAITYARRYALAAFFNLAPEDDDANAASGRTKAKAEPAKPPAPAPRPTSHDPNAILMRAVEVGVIPGPDRLMFKAWAREKVAGCQDIEDAAPLTPAHLAAIEKELAKPRALPSAEGRKKRALRTAILAHCRKLGMNDGDRHLAYKLHRISSLSDEKIDAEPLAAIEGLERDLGRRAGANDDPEDALAEYAREKGIVV